MKPVIEIEHLSWKYQNSAEFALRDVSLEIAEGEFVLVMGPNESGKTTLLMAIKGLIPQSFPGRLEGTARVLGELVERKHVGALARQVGFVFSDPEAQFTALTVEEEILFGLENVGFPEDQIGDRIRWASEITMIQDLLDKPPYDISGGEKQRVAIASVIAMDPQILILDEPTSMIDPLGKDLVVSICAQLKRERRMTILVAEHNLEAFAPLADTAVLVEAGRVAAKAPPRELFAEIERLVGQGVFPPQVTQTFARLRADGFSVPALPLSDAEGIGALRMLGPGAAR